MAPTSTPRQSSISVAVRVRPFTSSEENRLLRTTNAPLFLGDGQFSHENGAGAGPALPNSIRKIVNVVDDKMLIFDPPESNPLNSMQRRAFPNGLKSRIRDYRFVFDHLFDENASQQQVFESTTKPLLDSVLDGFNSTVFAYGATGCGKTHTIAGNPACPGVIFLTMQELYARIDAVADHKLVDVTISFLEIYNETIRDLLNPSTCAKKLNLREDSNKRIVVSNLSAHKPATVDEVMNLIMVGNQNRTSSPTEANAASSRSHAVLQINVTSKDRTANVTEEHTYATLSIIDLAGSERAAATRNRGVTLNEGANINKSLLALGNCINALCDPRRRNHIPYRDSKLTRLLKFSLGGNCKTVMIVCISPSSQHYDETLNTLKYADRAKEIKTKLVRNRQNLDRHVGSYLKMITEQKLEIEELRARETAVVQKSLDTAANNNDACLRAVLDNVAALRVTLDRQVHDKWIKYFSLAKRKLLLLHLKDLDLLVDTLQQHQHGHALGLAVKTFCIQADQLRNKFNEQVISLEQAYEARSEIDDIMARSFEHSQKRFAEMDGWAQVHTATYHALYHTLHDYIQKDLLVNSSILFDFLVGRLTHFDYLARAMCSVTTMCSDLASSKSSHSEVSKSLVACLEQMSDVLRQMNGSDYDVAIEEATSWFMNRQEKTETERDEKENGNGFGKDKRSHSSPLRSFPAPKRTRDNDDSHDSFDDSTMHVRSDLEDDSPFVDRIDKSLLEPEDLSFDSSLNSPPAKPKVPKLKPFSLTDTKLEPGLLKFPLLNKQASTKIVAKNEEQ